LPELAVLDSSAVLALLQSEVGSVVVASVVHGALLSSVNLAEIYTKAVLRGSGGLPAWNSILSLRCEICPLTQEQARLTGELAATTKLYGLSLGERACLALAIERKARAYTTDRTWKKLSLGVEIEVIR
jgi:ribonuclease VapC